MKDIKKRKPMYIDMDKDKDKVEWNDKEYKNFYPGKNLGLKSSKYGISLNEYNKLFLEL